MRPIAFPRCIGALVLFRARGHSENHEEIALIPLIGHTFGHAGVAVKSAERWLFQTGDAYFFHGEMDPAHPYCTPGLGFYQCMMEKDRSALVEPGAPARAVSHPCGRCRGLLRARRRGVRAPVRPLCAHSCRAHACQARVGHAPISREHSRCVSRKPARRTRCEPAM